MKLRIPFDADKHGHIIGDAVTAAMSFGTPAISAAREQMEDEGVAPPEDLDGIMFEALRNAGAFDKSRRTGGRS